MDSPHIKEEQKEEVEEAREEVEEALSSSTDTKLEPIEALGAQQLGNDLHPSDNGSGSNTDDTNPAPPFNPPSGPPVSDPTAPPPVPPPMPFQFGNGEPPKAP